MKTMRFIAVLAALSLSMGTMCQTTAQTKLKEMKAASKEKASNDAKQEAKRMKKEGWIATGEPLERQLDKTYMYMNEMDEDMRPVYVVGFNKATSESFAAARMQATELARQELSRSVGTEAASIVSNLVGTKQLPADEAASITAMISEGKIISLQKLGYVWVILEAKRVLPNKNTEVQIRLATKYSDVKEIAKNGIREELEKRGVKLSDQTLEMFNKK